MNYRIYNRLSKSYYQGHAGIGPRFGGTRATAHTFESYMDAYWTTCKHSFAFVGCEVEDSTGRHIGVQEGRALDAAAARVGGVRSEMRPAPGERPTRSRA